MGYKRAMTGTPSRSTSQPTITAIWKKLNQTRSPTKTQSAEDEEMYSDCRSGADQDTKPTILEIAQVDLNQTNHLTAMEEDVSGDSNATNKIENLQLTSTTLSDGSTLEDSRSLDTSSLIEFPPLRSSLPDSILQPPHTPIQNHSDKLARLSTPIPEKSSEKGSFLQMNRIITIDPTSLSPLESGVTKNNINALSEKTRPNTLNSSPLVEPTLLNRNSTSSNRDKVQYNPYLRQGAGKSVTSTHGNNSRQLDKKTTLKKGVTRSHIPRYNFRLKVKQSKTEDEEFRTLQQALQKFLDISLQADPSTTIPPFFDLDRNDKSVPDINSKHQVSDLDSPALLKQYFARLSNHNDKGNVNCSIILAQNISFHEFMDKARLSLANMECGLFQKACDHEDTVEIGWLLYSVRHQDGERLSELISCLVNENVEVKWKPIRCNDRNRKTVEDTSTRTYALHLETLLARAADIRQKLAT